MRVFYHNPKCQVQCNNDTTPSVVIFCPLLMVDAGNGTLSKVEFTLQPNETVYVILSGSGSYGYICGLIGKSCFLSLCS